MTDDSSGRVRHARRRMLSGWATWVISGVAAVLGFSVVYANTLLSQVDEAFTGVDNTNLISNRPSPGPSDSDAGRAVNILLMGSDVRTGENGNIGGVVGGMRNDTTIVMHVSADRSRVELVSIPRDAQVAIPDCKLNDGTTVKGWTGDFNIAFSNGGRHGNAAEAAACVINTVEQLTGVYIDHWAVVDFTGFISMIDSLGGVPMCIPQRIVSKKARVDLQAGPQVLNGTQALAFARLRTAEVGQVSGSDLQRINRQHELLRQVSRTALSKNVLTDIGQLTQFLKALAKSLTMDPELADTKYLAALAFSLRDINPNNIRFSTVPWKLTDDYLNVILVSRGKELWKQMREDLPLTAVATDTPGSTWDNGRKATPSPNASAAPSSAAPEPSGSLLSECR